MKFFQCLSITTLLFFFPATFSIESAEHVQLNSTESIAEVRTENLADLSRNPRRDNRRQLVSMLTDNPLNTASSPEVLNPVETNVLEPLPPFLRRDFTVRSAYLDAVRILREDNSCSRFFGGAQSIKVLNALARQLERVHIENHSVGIRMHSGFATFTNHQTGFSYRLFARATVNYNGPFYTDRRKTSRYSIGHFSSHTREARTLMLLHELAHLIQAQNGGWLIPDDGGNPGLSERNNDTVEGACRAQLLAFR